MGASLIHVSWLFTDNYIVIYEIGLDSITILNVKHASQKYP